MTLEADSQHPNKMKFRGILVQLDTPSTKPPNGAQGHRILVSTEVAKRRLKTLIGMGLNYAPDLDAHAQRRKVGVIDKAWIDGKDLRVEGHVWKHDFPEAEKDLKQSGLGMSMELGDVRVDNPNADVWTLDDFQFLGATILWRDSAAYNRTQAIAARAERRGSMPIPKRKPGTTAHASHTDRLVQIAAEAAAGAVKQSSKQLMSVLKTQTEVLGGIAAQQEELDSRLSALEGGDIAAANKTASSSSSSSSEDGMETRRVKAEGGAASSSSSSEEGDVTTRKVKAKGMTSSSSSSSSDDEDEDLDSAMDTGDLEDTDKAEGTTGHTNEDAENRGEDGAGDLIKKVGKTVESARIKSLRHQLKAAKRQLAEQQTVHASAIDKLNRKMEKLTTQVTAASDKLGRRSIAPEISAMLAKSNIDASDLFRTGTKMSVAEIDGILASSGLNLNSQDRMAMKNSFLKAGLMEDGRVERGTNR